MSVKSEIFMALIKKYVAPLLSEHGFRKHGLIWNRTRQDIIHVLQASRGRWDLAPVTTFEFDIGLGSKRAWQIARETPLPKAVKCEHCIFISKTGAFLRDKPNWPNFKWEVKSFDDVDAVGSDVQGILARECLPIIETADNNESMLEVAEKIDALDLFSNKPGVALLMHWAGRIDEAKRILAEYAQHVESVQPPPNMTELKNSITAMRTRIKEKLDELSTTTIPVPNMGARRMQNLHGRIRQMAESVNSTQRAILSRVQTELSKNE